MAFSAMGQEPGETVDEGALEAVASSASKIPLLEIMEQGGYVMIALAVLSVFAVTLILFYFLTLRKGAVVSNKFMNAADALIRKQDYLGLIAVSNRHNEAVARIAYHTMDFATKNPNASFAEVKEVAETEGTRQASILNQRITYLGDLGAIAPMVGLLGTVIGMIESFGSIYKGGFVGVGHMGLSGGVAKALITTAAGLSIGIPSMIFYSYFRGRVSKLISELEAASTHLLALLAEQYNKTTARGEPHYRPHPEFQPLPRTGAAATVVPAEAGVGHRGEFREPRL